MGSLLVATIPGVNYPLSAFVGDGVSLPYAIIDLNNAFSSVTKGNIDLFQGESLTLINARGLNGNSFTIQNLPSDNNISEIKNGDFGLKAGWNFISIPIVPNNSDLQVALVLLT